MPQPKNTTLRLLVPAIMIAVGLGVGYSVFKSVRNPPGSKAAQSVSAPAGTPAGQPAAQPGAATTSPQSPTQAAAPTTAGYHVVPATQAPLAPLGGLDPKGQFKAKLEFSPIGAGVAGLTLADDFETILNDKHVQPQQAHSVQRLTDSDNAATTGVLLIDGQVAMVQVNGAVLPTSRARVTQSAVEVLADDGSVFRSLSLQSSAPNVLVPFAALAIEITQPGVPGVIVPLAGPNIWQPATDRPGRFEATIADDSGAPALRLTREYTLAPSYPDIVLSQQVTNLSAQALSVKFYETGPVDLPQDAIGYGGDKRRLRFGYLLPSTKDPARATVLSSDFLMPRMAALDKREPLMGPDGKPLLDATGQPLVGFKDKALWPNERSRENGYDLTWAGLTNRYFGVAAHPVFDPKATSPNKTLDWVEGVSRVVLDGGVGSEIMALRLESKQRTLAPAGKPGAAADFTHGIYAGPLSRTDISKDPLLSSIGLTGLVAYNFGGMCAWCTFAPVTDLLLWVLHTLHDLVFRDWALSIIVLVLVVRTCLHPLVKWQQIKMARFGKQMQAMAPKQKLLQDKYKDDQKKLQEEMGKLWREEGISPTSFLGCLTMFLQMPIWYAMSALLYFSAEFRHEPAFYGLFQHIQPTSSPFWRFLGDLAECDRLLYFPNHAFTVPLIGGMIGPISSLNILPIIMGVVFFLQQKYLTPPTAATSTPEQEFQMKMMRWMSVLMMPLVMYNAPSGLALYFMCSSSFAILESRYVRAHMDKYDMLNVDKMKAQRQARQQAQPTGFMARLQQLAEEKQKDARKRAGLPPAGRRKP
jgi:YidC/Oxa1 family membrane protein insertase